MRGHAKTVEAMKWMTQNHADTQLLRARASRARRPVQPERQQRLQHRAPAQLQQRRADGRVRLRTQPGHGASDARGEYTVRRNNIGGAIGTSTRVGGTTYGGTGVYGAQIGGVWDALLGEGRNWWFFASSDWHNRGMFGPDDRRSSQDFFPGEYQRDLRDGGATATASSRDKVLTPQVDRRWPAHRQRLRRQRPADRPPGFRGLRGHAHQRCNSATLLVEAAAVVAAQKNTDVDVDAIARRWARSSSCARDRKSWWRSSCAIRPSTNYSPYTFPNPSLAQVGITQPLNKPVLDHVDVIRGMVTGYKTPGAADYSGQWPSDLDHRTPIWHTVPAGAKNTSAHVVRTFSQAHLDRRARRQASSRSMTFRIPAVNAVAVPAPARHEPAGRGAVRNRRRRQSAGGSVHQRRGSQPDAAGRHGWRAGERQPAHSVHTVGTNVPATATTYTGTTIDGCPAHLPVVERREVCRRTTSRPGRTCGSTAIRSTSKCRARRWWPASSKPSDNTIESRAPRGNARRFLSSEA